MSEPGVDHPEVDTEADVTLTGRGISVSGRVEYAGEAVDMSENGMRALIDGWGLPPEPGMKVDLTLDLGDGSMKVLGEILRQQSRGARWLMSIRFLGLQEKDEDRLRRRVFQALREERARDKD